MEIEESVVVFCHHKVIHKLLNESLEEFSPVAIIGGQSDDTRQDQIDKFQSGESKLMIAGIRAGNVGINLLGQNMLIFAELIGALQSIDRLKIDFTELAKKILFLHII